MTLISCLTTLRTTVSCRPPARHAWQNDEVTAHIATAFWIAYGRLAKITKPVTAASVRAVFIVALIIIAFSMWVFLNNTIAAAAADSIDQQNAAALRLWANLQILKSPPASAGQPQSAAESQTGVHVFQETVEFARKNQSLLQSAKKLHFWFNPWWTTDIVPLTFDNNTPDGVTHLLVPPTISSSEEIISEAVNQIKAYQIIRSYALSLYEIDSIVYAGAATTYLPARTLYALVGAFTASDCILRRAQK